MTKIKVTFAPGCFDSFEGTQEELDALIKELQEGFADGSLLKKSRPLDVEELFSEDPELFEALESAKKSNRTLQ